MDKRFISNLFKGLASTSFGSVVTIGFHFLSILFMTRYVSKDTLGMYFLTLAIVAFLTIVSGLGLDLTLSKFISGSDSRMQRDTIASTVTMRFVSITLVGIVFYATSRHILPFLDVRLNDHVIVMILLLALASYRDLFLSLMQGVLKFKEYAIVEILSAATRVILLIVFHDELGLQGLLYIESITQLIEVLLQIFFTRAILLSLSLRNIKSETMQNLARFSAPLYSNNILTLVHDRSSTFLIGALLNPVSVAAFEVALKIPDGFMRLFSSFIIVYFPNLSNLFTKGNREDAHRLMNSALILISTGGMFLVLISFLFANEIVLTLFSKEYIEVSLAFAFLMLNFCIRAIANIQGYSLVAAGQSSAPVKSNIVASTVNIIAGLVLIRRLGYIGAVYSLLLMNITSQVLYISQLKRIRLVPSLLAYLKPFFMLAMAMGIYWLFGANSILLKFLLIGFYIAGSWLFIAEFKEILRTALKYIFKIETRSELA